MFRTDHHHSRTIPGSPLKSHPLASSRAQCTTHIHPCQCQQQHAQEPDFHVPFSPFHPPTDTFSRRLDDLVEDDALSRVESRIQMYSGDDIRDPQPRHSIDGTSTFEGEEGSTSSHSYPPPTPSSPDPLMVTWDGARDGDNPQNWSKPYKRFLTFLLTFSAFNVTFASSAPAPTVPNLMQEFNVSQEVATLVVSAFLLGYVFGPFVWGPGSELIGRRPVLIFSLSCYTVFFFGQALATNIATLLVTRFLSGFFAVAPLTNAGGVIADLWDAEGRGFAMSIFSAVLFLGPVLGPIVGGFIVQSDLSWRWVFWVIMAFAGICTTLIFALPETYAPVLLAKRAKRLRRRYNDPRSQLLYAEHEHQDWSFRGVLHRTLYRPFQMLALEPILVLVTIYLSLVYGLIYALFEAFPIVFGQRRGFTISQVGLTYIAVGIGTSLGAVVNIWFMRDYHNLVKTWKGFPPPENRLPPAMVCAPVLVIGIFWLGWTGEYSSIPWIVPVLSAVLIGFGVSGVFMAFLSYLVDTYLMYSASAFAANTFIRSAVAAAFPLFTTQMFRNLGINWACTLIGFLTLILAPSPFLFYKYGARIRKHSRFAPCLDLVIAKQLEAEKQAPKSPRFGDKV
ncbi:MFS general substrate transporter [Pluteus cervinus]|uniref:MFS general substrate transporter n=1 Tax=Pluteus cervinus TaxID=181527 RepID=A0ACD3AJS6_9AGAR|nr:MFS general substrate transporter [Pluteus cervinus]